MLIVWEYKKKSRERYETIVKIEDSITFNLNKGEIERERGYWFNYRYNYNSSPLF